MSVKLKLALPPPFEALSMFTLSLLVANKPGVLGRVALVFSRRGFNIDSLNVTHTLDSRFSRMVITCFGDERILDDIAKQTRNLIDVIHFTVLGSRDPSEMTTKRYRVSLDSHYKKVVLGIIEEFSYRVVDFSNDSLLIEAVTFEDELETFVAMIKHYGTIEKI